MKNLKVTLKGTSPLLMHSCKCVNPLHPLSIELKKLTGLRGKNKTEEVLRQIADLEWYSGAYYEPKAGDMFDGELYMPAENIEATLINGAKQFKKGKDFEKYCRVVDLQNPFTFGEKKTLKELVADFNYRDTRAMTVMRSKIMRTRPRFNRWETTFIYMYDDENIDLQTIVNTIEYAGKYVGLCDSRPRYGQFVAIVEELD